MIKIWLLLSIVSFHGMPTVKHAAELYFEEPRCEERRIFVENKLHNLALEQGINPVFIQTWCLESSMFFMKNS